MEVKEIVKKKWKNPNPEKTADEVKKLQKEHSKLVKGMFEFVDAQGGWIDFTYRFFKDEPIQQIRLIHGEICELPMGIVRHLNNTYKKVRQFAASSPDKAVEMKMRGVPSTVEKTSRLRFTPVDVM
tara:strand:+ start:596 stop:973 length:378 start_codon:yes stop_codon:yes gene_type:complete